ncbi:LOW QUALITY PROTEIN: hypothetical protein M8C21_006884, partial [Ambrosia artemisiifolia]
HQHLRLLLFDQHSFFPKHFEPNPIHRSEKKNYIMATALAARQVANLLRLSSSRSAPQAASFIPRRGLSGAADHHGPPKVDFWKDPMSPSKWKEEHKSVEAVKN